MVFRRLLLVCVVMACGGGDPPATSGTTSGGGGATGGTFGTTFGSPDDCMSSEDCDTDGSCVAPYDPMPADQDVMRGPAACAGACIEENQLDKWCIDDASCCGTLRCNPVDGFCEPSGMGESGVGSGSGSDSGSDSGSGSGTGTGTTGSGTTGSGTDGTGSDGTTGTTGTSAG